MDHKKSERLRNGVVYIILIGLLAISFFILLNDQYGFIDFNDEEYLETDESFQVIDEAIEWSYLKEGENPGVGAVWTTPNYVEENWEKGQGAFATSEGEDVGTTLALKGRADEPVNSYFLRYSFDLTKRELEEIQTITGKVEYDGGLLVYLNGSIIFAGNVPQGGYSSNMERGVADEMVGKQQNEFELNDFALKEGENVIGLELHQKITANESLYVDLEEFKLSKKKLKKPTYNLDGLVLEQGKSDGTVSVNWLTDSTAVYEVEYIEAAKYKEPDDLEKYGKRVMMARKVVGDSDYAVHSAELPRLKDRTEYLYSIYQLGNRESSAMLQFTNGARRGYSFFAVEGAQMDLFADELAGVDFVIPALSTADQGKDSIFMDFRQDPLVKEKPILPLVGNYEGDDEGRALYHGQFNHSQRITNGNYAVTYQDSVILFLDTANKDYALHKKFLEQTIAEKNRKWNIVTGYNLTDNEEWAKILEELPIDLVLDPADYAAQVEVERNELKITHYNKATGAMIKEEIESKQ